MSLHTRLGAFFLIVAFLNMIVCYASVRTEGPLVTTLCIGSICAVLGVYLVIKGYSPPGGGRRFRTMRSLRSREKDEEES